MFIFSLLFPVPCESGNYWKCDVGECTPCPQGYYQPQWGQVNFKNMIFRRSISHLFLYFFHLDELLALPVQHNYRQTWGNSADRLQA